MVRYDKFGKKAEKGNIKWRTCERKEKGNYRLRLERKIRLKSIGMSLRRKCLCVEER